MKASKFTDAPKAFIIKQGEDGTAVAEICRKAGISLATQFNWKKGAVRRMRTRLCFPTPGSVRPRRGRATQRERRPGSSCNLLGSKGLVPG